MVKTYREGVAAEPISFRSSALEAADDGGSLSLRGELTMNGQSRPATFELSVRGTLPAD